MIYNFFIAVVANIYQTQKFKGSNELKKCFKLDPYQRAIELLKLDTRKFLTLRLDASPTIFIARQLS